MDLITTHVNADFDALGSLVAAQKLYPGARLLLPGSQEAAVIEFLSLAKELVNAESERECRLDDVTRLILVDTRHRSRIGTAAELVDRGVEVHIYDHHPRMKDDIVADRDVYEPVGATVSILADMIRKKRLDLSSLEATIMLLGIYEETGSLTYRATTKLDVDMVSFLLSKGANLSVVSSYLNRELSESELAFLTRLIATTERAVVKGVSVSTVVLDEASYHGELGVLIHKLMDIENIPLLFVFILTGRGRLDIVARSKLPSVDLNKLLSRFGGGGHPGAACAKIPGGDLETVRAKLMRLLTATIRSRVTAKDIMSPELGALPASMRVDEAKERLTAERAGGAPVIDRGRVVGIITMNGLNKALKGGPAHARVKGYLSRDLVTVKPSAPLDAIRRLMRAKGAGVILVGDGKRIRGVIRRTDVLKHVHDALFAGASLAPRQVIMNLAKKMRRLLPREAMRIARRAGELAAAHDQSAFLVGGVVRDILLNVTTVDLDIVIEGSAIEMGRALSHELGATLVIHKRFGTCTIVTKKRLKIDLATARREVYERPAALPTVQFGLLKDDLIRRDFTVNAMAISLNPKSFGQLVDFFRGQRDLARGRIRVLHDGSFIDDPTRIFRAVRFEQRLGFAIDHHTEELITHALREEMFEKVEPQRIRDEIVLILREEDPLKALRRMHELHELRFLHRKIRFDRDAVRLCHAIERAMVWYEKAVPRHRPLDRWLIYLMALLTPLGYNDTVRFCQRLVFRRGDTLRIVSYARRASALLRALGSPSRMKPSAVYRLLEPLSFEVIVLILARASLLPSRSRAGRVTARVREFLAGSVWVRIAVGGKDLAAMGLKPGPRFSKILTRLLYEKIDGNLASKKDEVSFVRKLESRHSAND